MADEPRKQGDAPSAESDASGSDPAEVRARSKRRLIMLLCVAAGVVVLDQVSKAIARATLVEGESVTLISGVIDLKLTYNTGAAFSLGEGAGPFYVLMAVVMFAFGVWLAWKRTDTPTSLVAAVACVVGGGIGNAIDRVVLGAVTDFFNPTFIDFAVFNVADSFITVGVIVAFLIWWRWDDAREDEKDKDKGDGDDTAGADKGSEASA